jgi:hypothetical protein
MLRPGTDIQKLLDEQQQSEEFSTKDTILLVLGGVIVIGGSIFLLNRWWKKRQANQEERKSTIEGNPADFAKRIKVAFENDGWPGTNNELLRQVIREIPSKELFNKVDTSFQHTDEKKRPLMKALEDELSSTGYEEIRAIILSKPQKYNKGSQPVYDYKKWVIRLKAAFDKTYGVLPGTDEDAIRAVFIEIPTQAAFVQVGKVYQQEYQRDLISDLKSELEFWEYPDFMKIITSKRP